jgi:hypothetical protein
MSEQFGWSNAFTGRVSSQNGKSRILLEPDPLHAELF